MKQPDPSLAKKCETIMNHLPATTPGRRLKPGSTFDWLQLSQEAVDIVYAALARHLDFAKFGEHEDAGHDPVDEILEILAEDLIKMFGPAIIAVIRKAMSDREGAAASRSMLG